MDILENNMVVLQARYMSMCDENMRKLRDEFQRDLQVLCYNAQPPSADWTSCPGILPESVACRGDVPDIVNNAIEAMAGYARQNLADCAKDESIRSDMRRAQALLEVPLVDSQIAWALDIVNSSRKSCNWRNEIDLKQAALTIRDVLVIKCCARFRFLDSDGFEDVMTDAFGSLLEDEEFESQLSLAFASVIRLGKDEEAFAKMAPKIFGRHLMLGDTEFLFRAYDHCAESSPGYLSRAKAGGKRRRGKKKKKDPTNADGGQTTLPPEDPWYLPVPRA